MLAEDMSARGYTKVSEPREADLAIIGTCVVIGKTEERMKRRIDELVEICGEVMVTGCLASTGGDELQKRYPGMKLVKPGEVEMSFDPGPDLIGVVPVSTGCTGDCTYCITRLARGALKSHDVTSIEKRFRCLLERGAKEIRVTSQDSASYGLDAGTSLIELMRTMDSHSGDHRIRLGMMNPDTAEPIFDELLDIMEGSHFYRFLHLPLQSGSDRILEKMNRRYTAGDWMELVERARRRIPEITISTDVITGFPGECEEDFQDTVKALERAEPDILNITRFSSRPGTEAHGMKDRIHSRTSKSRSSALTRIHEKISGERNQKYVGLATKALVLEKGKNHTVTGRTDSYKVVVLEDDPGMVLGTWVDVEITAASGVYLKGIRIQ